MPKDIVAVSQFTEEQVIDAYAVLRAADGHEETVLKRIGLRGNRLEADWQNHLVQRHEVIVRRDLEQLMAKAGQ